MIRDSEYEVSDVFPGLGSNNRHPLSVFPSLHRVPRDQFPGFISTTRVLRLPTVHPAALRCLRLAVPRLHSLPSLLDGRVRRRGLELVTRCLQPGFRRGAKQGSPKFLGNPNCPFAHVLTDSGRTACTRPLRCSNMALGMPTAKAPTIGLSKLNSMAFGLAVYASPGELPQPDAKLASGRWSGAAGRAFHPQGSDERFQRCYLHLIPLSQACLAQWHRPTQDNRHPGIFSGFFLAYFGLSDQQFRAFKNPGRNSHRCAQTAPTSAVSTTWYSNAVCPTEGS